MKNTTHEKTFDRIPQYIAFLESYDKPYTSATIIAEALTYGHVLVRKDLAKISSKGKPKIGYAVEDLLNDLKYAMGYHNMTHAVMVGRGRLGLSLKDYEGFRDLPFQWIATFDVKDEEPWTQKLSQVTQAYTIQLGVITVPKDEAQTVCDALVLAGIKNIWNFAPTRLQAPIDVTIYQEDLSLSLSKIIKMIHQ